MWSVQPEERGGWIAARTSRRRPHACSNCPGYLMITRRRMIAVTGGAALAAAGRAAANTASVATQQRNAIMEIKRNGSQPSRPGSVEYFSGQVRIDPLFQAPDPARVGGGSVTFEPGARTAWPTHALPRPLILSLGLGWGQGEGGPTEAVPPRA